MSSVRILATIKHEIYFELQGKREFGLLLIFNHVQDNSNKIIAVVHV